MKKTLSMKKIFFAALFTAACSIQAQQVALFSQYLNNDFLLNPAIAGTKTYAPVSASARMQWVNFNGAPNTQIGSIHGAMTQHVGIGFALTNHTAAANTMTSAQLTYAYRTKINDKIRISMGLSPMIIQHTIAKDKLTLEDANDNTFVKMNGKTTIADLNAGVYVYGAKWVASVSAPQLFESKYRMGDDLFKERLRRHFLIYGSYDFAINDKFTVTPGALIKAMQGGAPLQVDVNGKVVYNKMFWMGLSYRSSSSQGPNEAAVVLVGIQKGDFVFGYSYDYSFSSMRSYSMGSHEFFLTYRLKCKECDKAIEVPETSAKEAQ